MLACALGAAALLGGSATDVAARMMADKLLVRWGQPVVIKNKPGADGLLAINAFVQANDDHTLLYASSGSFMAHPCMHEKLAYSMERDPAPIARVTDTVLSTNVPAVSTIKTLADFVARARAEPGKLNVTGAPGTPDFTLDYFIQTQGLDVVKVPFKNIVEGAKALAANQIDFLITSVAIVRPLVARIKYRADEMSGRNEKPGFGRRCADFGQTFSGRAAR